MNTSSKLLLSSLLALSTNAFAAGFQIYEQSASDLGTMFSGTAAIAQDATTGFYNAAGLAYLKPKEQIAASGILVLPKMPFKGTAIAAGVGSSDFNGSGTAANNLSGIIPSIHYFRKLSDQWYLGFGVTAPYGLSEEYPSDSIVRYTATKASLRTLNLSPSVAYKINEKLSVGLGVDMQRAEYDAESHVRTSPDSFLKTEYRSNGYGWHGGILYQATETLRVGLSYRSQVVHKFGGDSSYTNGNTVTKTYSNTSLKLPPITSLGIVYEATPKLRLLGTAEYTQWSTIKDSVVYNVAALPGVTVVTPKFYRNTWRYALGTNYQLTPKLQTKLGVSFDQGATQDMYREITVPDQNYIAVALGSHYQITKMVGLDAGYSHLFFKTATINQTANPQTIGSERIAVDLLGLQVTWNLG